MNITERILYLNPSAMFMCRDNDYNQIVWNANHTGIKPSLLDIEGVTQTQLDISKYSEKRTEAYASLGEQLDMQYKDALNGTTTWQDHISTVKALYPKA